MVRRQMDPKAPEIMIEKMCGEWPVRKVPEEFFDTREIRKKPMVEPESDLEAISVRLVRFEISEAEVGSAYKGAGDLAEDRDLLEEQLEKMAEKGMPMELSIPGQELDGSLFWIFEIFVNDDHEFEKQVKLLGEVIRKGMRKSKASWVELDDE